MADSLNCPRCLHPFIARELKEGESTHCSSCNFPLRSLRSRRVYLASVVALIGLISWYMAVSSPFLSVAKIGLENDIYIVNAATALITPRFFLLGLFVALFLLILPLVWLALVLLFSATLITIKYIPRSFGPLLRYTTYIRPWAMADIFFVGVMVAAVKLVSLVNLEFGPAFWSLMLLSLCLLLSQYLFHVQTLWYRLK